MSAPTKRQLADAVAPTEIALMEKAAERAGMVSMLNHGAASCVYSEGCAGVTQDHLLAYTREVALHCVVALGHLTPTQQQAAEPVVWQPIETAPKDGTPVLLATRTGRIAGGQWHPRYGTWGWPYVMVNPTHWMPLPDAPNPHNIREAS